ncbi:MAG: hypothetical protein AYK19_13710 [Theionarchaea archaeon DG-70-1]|nr:MAG: hypothetical protein AYK19_13710 [Theionarchaea archaeon DG-70-1]
MGKVQEFLERKHEVTRYRPFGDKPGWYRDNYHCKKCNANAFRIDYALLVTALLSLGVIVITTNQNMFDNPFMFWLSIISIFAFCVSTPLAFFLCNICDVQYMFFRKCKEGS